MEQRISFVSPAVRDLEIARAFSVDGLGWVPELDVPGEVLMFSAGERLGLARDAGAPVWGPVEREWGGFTGYLADPDGFRWEVARNPGPIGLRVVPGTDVDAQP